MKVSLVQYIYELALFRLTFSLVPLGQTIHIDSFGNCIDHCFDCLFVCLHVRCVVISKHILLSHNMASSTEASTQISIEPESVVVIEPAPPTQQQIVPRRSAQPTHIPTATKVVTIKSRRKKTPPLPVELIRPPPVSILSEEVVASKPFALHQLVTRYIAICPKIISLSNRQMHFLGSRISSSSLVPPIE